MKQRGVQASLLSPSWPRPAQVSGWPADNRAEEPPPGASALPAGADVAGAIGRARVWPEARAQRRAGASGSSASVWCRRPRSSGLRVRGAETPPRGGRGLGHERRGRSGARTELAGARRGGGSPLTGGGGGGVAVALLSRGATASCGWSRLQRQEPAPAPARPSARSPVRPPRPRAPRHFPAALGRGSRRRGRGGAARARPGPAPRGGRGRDGGSRPRLPFLTPPAGDEGKMSVSGLKAELKFLASIFDKNHERFRIVSWKLDELHCQFLVPPPPPPPGSPHSPPPPPLTLHCNITVRRRAAAPRGRARADGGRRSPGTKGACPGDPRRPGRGRLAAGPRARPGARGCLAGRQRRRVSALRGPAWRCWPLAAPVGPRGRHGRPQPACSGDRGASVGSGRQSRWRGAQVFFSSSFPRQVSNPSSLLVGPVFFVSVLVSEDR